MAFPDSPAAQSLVPAAGTLRLRTSGRPVGVMSREELAGALDRLRAGVVAAERWAFSTSLSAEDIENLYSDACLDALRGSFTEMADVAAYVRRHVHNRRSRCSSRRRWYLNDPALVRDGGVPDLRQLCDIGALRGGSCVGGAGQRV